ncbi:unnamed protein product [Caenorhabditis nigoni]
MNPFNTRIQKGYGDLVEKMRLLQKTRPWIYRSSCREEEHKPHEKDAPIGKMIDDPENPPSTRRCYHQQYHNSVHFHLKAKKFCSSPPSRDSGRTTYPSNNDENNSKTTRPTYPPILGFKTHPPRKIAQECPGCTTLDSEEAGRTTNYPLLDSQKTTADYLDVVEFKTHPPRKNEADSTHPPRKDEPRDSWSKSERGGTSKTYPDITPHEESMCPQMIRKTKKICEHCEKDYNTELHNGLRSRLGCIMLSSKITKSI